VLSENRKLIGNSSTGSLALLVGALIFSPAFLIAVRPFGNISRWLTTVYTASGMALAWIWSERRSAASELFEDPIGDESLR